MLNKKHKTFFFACGKNTYLPLTFKTIPYQVASICMTLLLCKALASILLQSGILEIIQCQLKKTEACQRYAGLNNRALSLQNEAGRRLESLEQNTRVALLLL